MVTQEPVLRMAVRRDGCSAVLQLGGEADIATEPRLSLRLRRLLSDGELRSLVVDLRGLAFLDLTALRLLLGAAEELRGRGGSLVLRSPARRVRRLLEVVGTGDRLPVQDD